MPIDFKSLSNDQKEVAKKVAAEAELQGIDPSLALAVAYSESRFKHYAGDGKSKLVTSPTGAVGALQTEPATVDAYNKKFDMNLDPHNVDDNIKAGVFILKDNLEHYGNPLDAVVAYNTSVATRNKFFESRDFKDLPVATRKYLLEINENHPLDQTEPALEPAEEEGPFGRTEALPPHLNESSTINTPADKSTLWSDIKENPEITGAIVGGVSGAAERLHKFGKEVPKVVAEETIRNAPNLSAGQKWASAIGGPGGETVTEAARNLQLSKGLKGGETLTESGVVLLPGAKEKLESELETRGQQISRKLKQKIPMYEKGVEAGKHLTKGAAKLMSKLAPLSTAATGFGVGMNIDELAQRMHEGDTKGAMLSGVTGAANLASLIPGVGMARGIGTLAAIPLNVADIMYSPDEERSIVKDFMKKKEQNKAKGGSVLPEPAFPLSRRHVYFHRLKRQIAKKKS